LQYKDWRDGWKLAAEKARQRAKVKAVKTKYTKAGSRLTPTACFFLSCGYCFPPSANFRCADAVYGGLHAVFSLLDSLLIAQVENL